MSVWGFPRFRQVVPGWVLLCILVGLTSLGPVKARAAEFNNPNLVATLIHNTVMALNHANLSGNYTVLRDLGSPQFRTATTSARLASIFQAHRKSKLDMSAVVLFRPQLKHPAQLTNSGHLRIVGFYPTKPLQINFDLTYQIVNGKWRIFRISVSPTKPAVVAKIPAGTPAKKKSKKRRKVSTKTIPRRKPKKTTTN